MRAALFLSLVLLPLRAWALFDVFLEVTPASGPALAGSVAEPLYSGWIAVAGFESGIFRETVTVPIPGQRTSFREFAIVKTVDAATTKLFQTLTAGTALATVKMVVVLRTPQRVELWDIKASTCFLTRQSFSAQGGDGKVTERITFAVRQFEWSYIQLNAAGDPIAEIFANWDTGTGTLTAGTRVPSFPGGVDTDGDGIPDGWELFYGLNRNVADSTLDTDGDGLDNLHEYIAHTDPRVPQSVLRVTAFQPAGVGNFSLTWQSIAGLNYRIFTAPAPGGPFTFLKNVASSGDGTTSTTVTGPAGQFFYRVVTP